MPPVCRLLLCCCLPLSAHQVSVYQTSYELSLARWRIIMFVLVSDENRKTMDVFLFLHHPPLPSKREKPIACVAVLMFAMRTPDS